MPRTFGSLSAYEPGLMDQARWWLQDKLTPVLGGDARRAGDFVQNKVMPTAEYLPGVGDAMAAGEAVDYFKQGQPIFGTLAAAGAAAGLVPGVGDAVQKGVKKGINIVRKTPTMADAYIDDAFAGTVSLSENHPFVSAINVEPQYRGQGIGRELYAEAEKMAGQPLFPSPLGLTEDATKVWQKRLAAMPADEARKLLDMAQQAGEGYGIPASQVAERLMPLRNALQPQGIRAYHGSPHDFDKFSLDKIGTGEGAQAYGHGLYFADNEDVARGYRDRLAPGHAVFADGAHVDSLTWLDQAPSQKEWGVINAAAEKAAGKKPSNFQPWMSDAIAKKVYQGMRPNADGKTADWSYIVNSAIENMSPRGRAGLSLEDQLAIEEYAMAIRDNLPPLDVKKSGRMYEVNINADPNDFLDWDKPLSEQPEAVRNALARTPWGDVYQNSSLPGGQIAPRTFEGTQQLREAGIPGIKYLDAGSRSAGDGSRNYVVFDDALIEILRKYGLAGLGIGVGAGGFGSLAPQDDNYQPPQL